LRFGPPLPKAETDAVALLLLFTAVIRSLLRNSKVIGRIGGGGEVGVVVLGLEDSMSMLSVLGRSID
jgi:hypothetical protein